ncbi:hypothetical protein [Sphingobium xenophagum]|uniref:Uncharacterized protein n=1 Tax=Sphingobium xenophagum TaxID=121428 RepID=A0A401IZ79_SPHXE|nr:hypothetical protein [Sphingobium xenophagum]GBH29678.1 hypothetical protein MBESOW_P0932 [Sphingobium xenophagum]
MTKAKTKTKPATPAKRADVTVHHGGEIYTLLMGTAAFLQLETALGKPLQELGETLTKPGLSTLRDLIAAALIEHHPQGMTASDFGAPGSSALRGFLEAQGVGGLVSRPVAHWPAQQALANRIMDEIGMDAAADLIAMAVEASPHLQSLPA